MGAACLLSNIVPSRAQSYNGAWSIESVGGVGTVGWRNWLSGDGSTPKNASYDFTVSPNSPFSYMTLYPRMGKNGTGPGSGTLFRSQKFKVTCVWNSYGPPGAATSPVPDRVSLLCSLWASANSDPGTSGQKVDDGFGHAPVPPALYTSRTDKQIYSYATGGQRRVVVELPVMSAEVSGQNLPGNVSLVLGVYTSGSFKNDTRSVLISSPTIETSYEKWYATPTSPDPIKRPIVPNADGSKWTHSALQWDKTKKKWVANTKFNATISGFSLYYTGTTGATDFYPPKVEWKYRGRGSAVLEAQPPKDSLEINWNPTQNLNLEIDGPDPENLSRNSLSGFPAQGTVQVKVTDRIKDGAVAENAMLVNWHLPVENIVPLEHDPVTDTIEPQWTTPYSTTLPLNGLDVTEDGEKPETPLGMEINVVPKYRRGDATLDGNTVEFYTDGAAAVLGVLPAGLDIVAQLWLAEIKYDIVSQLPPPSQPLAPVAWNHALWKKSVLANRADRALNLIPSGVLDLTDAENDEDTSWTSSRLVGFKLKVPVTKRRYKADTYDINGYKRQVIGSLVIQTDAAEVYGVFEVD